jgi:hypothetical protein
MAAILELTADRAAEFRSEAFWREAFPELSIGGAAARGATDSLRVLSENVNALGTVCAVARACNRRLVRSP